MSTDRLSRQAAESETSVWRLGEVLEELLLGYGLSEASAVPEGNPVVCRDAGIFSAADLPAITTAAY